MIHSCAVRDAHALKERERSVWIDKPRKHPPVVSTETAKASCAVAREAERVRLIRLLMGESNMD